MSSLAGVVLVVAGCGLVAAGQAGAGSAPKAPGSVQVGPAAAVHAAPEHPATEAQVRRLLAETHAAEVFRAQLQAAIDAQKKNLPPVFPPEFWADIQTEFGKIDVVALALPTYQHSLSAEDAEKILAFYQTPAGKSLIEVTPALTAELQQKGFELGKKIGQQVGEKYRPQIEENVKKMQQSNAAPASAAPASAAPAKPAPAENAPAVKPAPEP